MIFSDPNNPLVPILNEIRQFIRNFPSWRVYTSSAVKGLKTFWKLVGIDDSLNLAQRNILEVCHGASAQKERWLNVLRFVRRSTILESKPELLEKVVKKSHHNGKVCYVNHYSLSVWNLSPLMRHNRNWTYDLQLLTHLRPITNALDYSRNCGSKFWNSDGNFFGRYHYNIP